MSLRMLLVVLFLCYVALLVSIEMAASGRDPGRDVTPATCCDAVRFGGDQ